MTNSFMSNIFAVSWYINAESVLRETTVGIFKQNQNTKNQNIWSTNNSVI